MATCNPLQGHLHLHLPTPSPSALLNRTDCPGATYGPYGTVTPKMVPLTPDPNFDASHSAGACFVSELLADAADLRYPPPLPVSRSV